MVKVEFFGILSGHPSVQTPRTGESHSHRVPEKSTDEQQKSTDEQGLKVAFHGGFSDNDKVCIGVQLNNAKQKGAR